jgi:hypothetical protein
MAEYQYLGAEIEKTRAETRVAVKKRYRGLLALGFAASGFCLMFAGLPDLVGYLMWAVGVAAWMYVKTV